MTRLEIRASALLASIFALRMLGLFLILPVFAVYAKTMPGGESTTLIGFAMGMYGLTQAFGQIPLGTASDRCGRKPVIIAGMAVFALGSFVAAWAPTLQWVLIGRAIQGAGAVSAAITASVADVTREEHRTKAMAMIGASIGVTYSVSMVAAPILYSLIGMKGIFALTGFLALIAVAVVAWIVPPLPPVHATAPRVPFREVLANRELLRLDFGVFALHMTQMAMFVVVPTVLVQYMGLPLQEHWKVYLPVMIASFVLMLPPVIVAERHGKMKPILIGSIALLLLVQIGLGISLAHAASLHWGLLIALLLFFVSFNILEASLPSLVSRVAPPAAKGAALGIYNTLQPLGIFCGASLGGWMKQHVGPGSIFGVVAVLTIAWLIIAAGMKNPPQRRAASAVV